MDIKDEAVEAEFQRWWRSSKYCQVIYPKPHLEQYARDGFRAGITAALPHMGGVSEEMLIAAFLRGESWRKRNDVDRYVAVPEMVEKAARDYADAILSALASHEPATLNTKGGVGRASE